MNTNMMAKKQKTKNNIIMNAAIPEEIVFEILKRLPVKSLCRFRAVSKRWLSIITSRPFIDSHFEISKLNPTRLFGFYNINAATTQYYSYNPETSFLSTNNPEKLYKLWDRYYPYCSISPRGLICFYSGGLCDYDTVQIWNPSTGEYIEVNHKPPRKLQKTRSAYFLGFDPVSKKHKLLISPSFIDSEYYLLTLGEKNWRKITPTDDNGSSIKLYSSYEHCSIDGIVYYLEWSRDEYAYTNLVAFDFGSERFLETILLPKKLGRFLSYYGGRIWVYRGRIVLLNYLCNGGFEMWVLEDVEKQKWSHMRIIPPPPPLTLHHKFGVIDGEELLIFSSSLANSEGFRRLCRYDLEKDKWSETPFPDFWVEDPKLGGSAMYMARLYYYVDSLESLKSRTLSIEEEDGEEDEVVSLN